MQNSFFPNKPCKERGEPVNIPTECSRIPMDSPTDNLIQFQFLIYVATRWAARRVRDSFAFSAAQKIIVSMPSSRHRPSCHRQLGFYFRIPNLSKKESTPLGVGLSFYENPSTSLRDAAGFPWILPRTTSSNSSF